MKTYSKILLSTLVAAAVWAPANAIPAKPGLVEVTQADGTTLQVRIMGDERHHIYLSDDGYLLANDKDTYYYADVDDAGEIVRSNIRATASAMRDGVARSFVQAVDMPRVYEKLNARAAREASPLKAGARRGPGLFPGTHFPAMGKQKAIVILVEYKDVKMTLDDAHDYFHRMLNEPGFSDYGGTGSAVDFFLESSMGQFEPQFDVFGPITLSQNRSYYGGNDWYGNDSHPEEMIIEACQQLDATVDFSEYDRDGDGYIDNVFVFYAGRGEASGGSSDTVWPHSWDISAATSVPYYFDGVRLDRYGCSNEYESGRPDGVGTFVHEFSHVMGLPDLYATSYTSAFTPGAWSALDYGPYNNDGCTPPLYSAFERYALNWLEPAVIDGPLNATLNPIGTNQAGIIRTSSDDEFFLLENRQQRSWDTYIPGHGMLIWHVDYNASVWTSNTVNNSGYHQYVDIEEADGTQSDYSREGDTFPGSAGVTSFTDDTSPSMKTWSGQRLNLPITDIAESHDGIITFKVCGGREPLEPTVALDVTDCDSESFTAAWESAGPDATYVLSVYTRRAAEAAVAQDGEGEPVYLDGYRALAVGTATSHKVTGLQPETDYYYVVRVGGGLEMSEPSNEIAVFTGRLPISRRAVVAEDAYAVTEDGFTAAWQLLEDAESYTLSIYTKEWGAPIPDGCDFGSDVKCEFPEGWSSTSGASYANTAYSGAAVPALRLSSGGDYLETPVYDDGIRALSFWHRGSGTSTEDRIIVSAGDGTSWSTVAEFPVVTAKGGSTIELDATTILEGTQQMRIGFRRFGNKGAVAIDDVVAGHGISFSAVPVEGFTDYPAGSGTECIITGLQPETDYFYTVRGVDTDGRVSLPSQEIAVTTAKPSVGITDADVSAGAAITSTGLTVELTGAPAGTELRVYDAAGRLVAATTAASLAVPSPGLYIATAPALGLHKKIALR
ncbi:MAG: M6 family metalloprotease domain-containing protein [Muribaculaceae bacterium]|nr:M6 family metalloprotease domain-containing protein [Muribaculaceae bacterium]